MSKLARAGSLAALCAATFAFSASAADAIEPGLYEITTKSNFGTSETRKQCLTQADILKGMQPDTVKDCKTTRSVFAGGKFDYYTTCPDTTSAMTGTYTATSYRIDGRIQIKGDKGDEPMSMESHITAKRLAATCKP